MWGANRDNLSALQYAAPPKRQIKLINDARHPAPRRPREFSLTSLGRFSVALACLVLSAASAWSARAEDCQGAPSTTRLIVSVEGVRTAEGYVVATLFGPDPSRYLVAHGELFSGRAPAQVGVTSLCFYLPAPGPYEVVAFHDANANGKLDQGLFRRPIEGFGFSNNVRPVFRAPSMESTQIQAGAGDTRLHIRLRYP
jgi:uncharacterized protein (DUF2141 family)